jgi:hypothetical protein
LTWSSERKQLLRNAAIAFAMTAALFSATAAGASADYNNASGSHTAGYDPNLYAVSATLTANTLFHAANQSCVLQAINVSIAGGGQQAQTGLLRCNNWSLSNGCVGGTKIIELEVGGNYTCYVKGDFNTGHDYPASVYATAGSSYTSWTASIDGETVNHYTVMIYGVGRQGVGWGEVSALGSDSCPTASVDMHFSNFTKYTTDSGSQYVTGHKDDYFSFPPCFEVGDMSSTGDFHVRS